jgi:thiol-disulfide isomerase/thioredoxin
VLKDMNGADVRLSDFRGRPMVVNLWATWCAPCQREMPQLVALAEKFSEARLVVIGISTDDAPAEIQAFAKAFSVTYPLLVGRDRSDVLVAFEYTGLLPTTVFINAEGMITARLVGRASDAYFERQIRGTR